jgi:hypothetical protein
MNAKPNLQIGQAYIVDHKPMVLTEINYRERKDDEVPYFCFTDGRYGFGRTLGARKSDCEILDNLKIAEGIDPQDILDKLKDSINSMVQFYITKGKK